MRSFQKRLILFFVFMLLVVQVQAATFTVSSIENSGPGTLRQAIEDANADTGTDTIVFTTSDSITAYSGLMITRPVVIDGGYNTVGASSGFVLFDLSSNAAGSIIRNLALVNSGQAIYLSGANNVQIMNCRIGLDWADAIRGNSWGIMVDTCTGTIIGSAGMGNVISGNSENGIVVKASTGTIIQGNKIGTDSTGMLARSNTLKGIRVVDGSSTTLIGGNRALGEGNLISGNSAIAIEISNSDGYGGDNTGAPSPNNTIAGNVIGLNGNQTAQLANGTYGVRLGYSPDNRIGLNESGKGNIIAGNNAINVMLEESARIIVQNNFIGCNESSTSYGNNYGVLLSNAKACLIGGNRYATAYESNVISGHNSGGRYGIGIQGSQAKGNTIAGNYIGTNSAGTAARPNHIGVSLGGASNLVGGLNTSSTSLYGNIISGNTDNYGVDLSGSGNTLLGNYIGLDISGTLAIPNQYGVVTTGGRENAVGNGTPEGRNVISGNTYEGLRMEGATWHQILGNYLGTNATGTQVVANQRNQIWLTSASNCLFGGETGKKNLICGNNYTGLFGMTADTNGNTIVGNWFNLYADGTAASTKLTNGVYFQSGPHDNSVGLKSSGLGNLIVGTQTGILLSGAATNHNGFYANTICSFAYPASGVGITLNDGNDTKGVPVISIADAAGFSGTSGNNDYIQIFRADRNASYSGGSLTLLGTTVADGSGNWTWTPSGLVYGDYVCALASDSSNNNTSQFSANKAVTGLLPPTATSTTTPTVTPTATFTVTATPVIQATATTSPTTISTVTPTPTANLELNLNGQDVLAYPNPGRERICFAMNLESSSDVLISLFNSSGEKVASLNETLQGADSQVVWDCHSVAAGIYLARVQINGKERAVLKVAVIK